MKRLIPLASVASPNSMFLCADYKEYALLIGWIKSMSRSFKYIVLY